MAIFLRIHVVDRSTRIRVIFADGTDLWRFASAQPERDMPLAAGFLRLPAATLGSGRLIGDEAYVVGNPLVWRLDESRVISGFDRTFRAGSNQTGRD
jgi:hypothetical protein